MIRKMVSMGLAAMCLSGCLGNATLPAQLPTQRPDADPVAGPGPTRPVPAGNILPQTGRGNAGGILARAGQPSVVGVEASMSYRAGGRGSGVIIDFHNGAITGVGVRCNRAGGGGTVPECTATNAESAWLVNELSTTYAYAGAIAVNGHGPGRNQDGFVAIHASTSDNLFVALPPGQAAYRGQMQGAGALTTGGQTFEGRVSGDTTLSVDFDTARLSGEFRAEIIDDRARLSRSFTAGFTNARIGPDGRFFNTTTTTYHFAGAQAWGELDAAFYGPEAENAAGTFSFGSERGGITGIFVGCHEDLPANCVHPSPRF